MKIDEPKTPFAPHYNPDEDEDMMMEGDIPSLDIGEGHGWGGLMNPQTSGVDSVDGLEAPRERRMSTSSHGSEKHVGVNPKDASPTHDAEREPQSEDEKRKHDMFERKRKQHYEMSGIKNLLGKSIDIDEDDEDEDDDNNTNGNGNDNDDDNDDDDGDINMEPKREQKKVQPPIPPIPGKFKQ
ncbi:histone methyltransferase set1 [Ascosphaera pollenicola]|nr:histone methyltransferase set1 [Ascosphaera pollenicola]